MFDSQLLQSIVKEQTEMSKMEGDVTQHEADKADLQNQIEEKSECIKKLESKLADMMHKDEAKAKQLKSIEQMTAKVPKMLPKMSFDDIKELLIKICQMAMTEEAMERKLPLGAPKKPVSTAPQAKPTVKREQGPPLAETCWQRSTVTRDWNKPHITPSTAKPAATTNKEIRASRPANH